MNRSLSSRQLVFLKKLYDLSDETLISSAQTDMAYKFFLDLEPEAKMIDPSPVSYTHLTLPTNCT